MPELPEVQTIVNDLNKKIIGRKITDVWSDWIKLVKKPPFNEFKKLIKKKKILGVKRRGKNILINLSENLALLIHQKMTGHLLVGKWEIKKVSGVRYQVSSLLSGPLSEKVNDYIHLIFYLDNGNMLALSDLRKFAKIVLGSENQIEELADIKKLGPEPLDPSFKFDKFVSLVSSEKRKIKQVLMDQEVIAGIGNIYSDDILWKARTHPFKPANKLSDKELKSLYSAMKEILKKGLRLRGTSISDYRDTAGKRGGYDRVRLVYQREGEKCARGNGIIKRIKMGGRSAHFCPVCQKL